MGKVKNRLKYWRHQLLIDSQVEFAALLGVSEWSLNRWEQQRSQPNLETLMKIFNFLKPRIPNLHLEDLIEIESDDPE